MTVDRFRPLHSFAAGVSHQLKSLIGLLLCCAVTLCGAAAIAQGTPDSDSDARAIGEEPVEIVVIEQPRREYIHRGWEPDSAADVDAELQRTYEWLDLMADQAEACDIDSIEFLQTYAQRKPCEDFLESVSAYIEYYQDACAALTEWQARFIEELRAIPNVETEYAGTLNWLAVTRQNIDITCNMTKIRVDRPKFEVAIDQIDRIVRFVNSDSWLGADGAPRQLPRGGAGLPTQGQSVIPSGPN